MKKPMTEKEARKFIEEIIGVKIEKPTAKEKKMIDEQVKLIYKSITCEKSPKQKLKELFDKAHSPNATIKDVDEYEKARVMYNFYINQDKILESIAKQNLYMWR